jgi:hypothetical protein
VHDEPLTGTVICALNLRAGFLLEEFISVDNIEFVNTGFVNY